MIEIDRMKERERERDSSKESERKSEKRRSEIDNVKERECV